MSDYETNPMRISSSAHSVNRNIIYVQPEVIRTLLEVSSRGELISGRVTDDELPAIACLPDTDERDGFRIIMSGRGKTRAQVTVPSEDIPEGRYIMDSDPTYEDGLDWFILREVEA